MKVAIHQPNFCPWTPYIHKIQSCDVFVILTHCQYEKNNYQNRFQLDGKWYTCRVDKSSGSKATIAEKKYVDFVEDWIKIKESIPKKYRYILDGIDQEVPHEYFDEFDNFLSDINYEIITSLYGMATPQPTTTIMTDWETDKTGTERLVDIVSRLGGTEYVSGPTGPQYMDMSLWDKAGIKVSVVPECTSKVSILEYLSSL